MFLNRFIKYLPVLILGFILACVTLAFAQAAAAAAGAVITSAPSDLDRLLAGQAATGWVFWGLLAMLVIEQVLPKIPENIIKANSTVEMAVNVLKAIVTGVTAVFKGRTGS